MNVEEKVEVKYPVSEIFVAPQGEGNYAGLLMLFVRLAGCNVGKPIDGSKYLDKDIQDKNTEKYGVIPIWQEECQAYVSSKPFLCDTDFRVKARMHPLDIIACAPDNVTHMCITGGEPLIHDIEPLVEVWINKIFTNEKGFSEIRQVHIETSGTKIINISSVLMNKIWITVSPKKNCTMEMAMMADEVKFLVDENFDEKVAEAFESYVNDDCIIWVSPINGVSDLNKENMNKCLELIHRHPNWRITNQNHKLWGTK